MAKTTDIALSTFAAASADLDLGSQKIINLADPTADQEAATKKYVDDSLDALRQAVTKSTAVTLTDSEVLGGLVLVTDAVAITLPAAATGNEGADLYISATTAGATLVCGAGFHGGGTDSDVLAFAAYEGAHLYSDGSNWYLLGSGPGCTLS